MYFRKVIDGGDKDGYRNGSLWSPLPSENVYVPDLYCVTFFFCSFLSFFFCILESVAYACEVEGNMR